MLDITGDHVAALNDTDLRALVGLLCEAELDLTGHSTAAVTWGGSQTAPDGGIDVRVELPVGALVDGFIPSVSTGFQVKKPDMPKGEIITEMRPKGVIRESIVKLAAVGGAYIIVSSSGSTADSALTERNDAMRDALSGVANADQLTTLFYDRGQLATWVRRHPALIVWVKERIGQAVSGWHPFGSWSASDRDVKEEYLLDDEPRVTINDPEGASALSVMEAIARLRTALGTPRKVLRMVGLSGVGKTRLLQALFDKRVGQDALPASRVFYTNFSNHPDPHPLRVISDLIARRRSAVVIVDNCPQDVHRGLSALCQAPNGLVSIITVEYDVRDDQPEHTQVIKLGPASYHLTAQLVRLRCHNIRQQGAATIAQASGGNARIALALASTFKSSEHIAGISDDELFQRLFVQKHQPDVALFRAAQALSIVYSFQWESLAGEESEIPLLAELVGQSAQEIYRHAQELLRRDLIQKRGKWMAVLPHALANRLALGLLRDTSAPILEQQMSRFSARMLVSLSTRFSFLHADAQALGIIKRWLGTGGYLADLTASTDEQLAMFLNVAPLMPSLAIRVLERGDYSPRILGRYAASIHRLACCDGLFERAFDLLKNVAVDSSDAEVAKNAAELAASLFFMGRGEVSVPCAGRLLVVEPLLMSQVVEFRTLGFKCLDAMLGSVGPSTTAAMNFEASSVSEGFVPLSEKDRQGWLDSVLGFICQCAENEVLKAGLQDCFVFALRRLCGREQLLDTLFSSVKVLLSGRFHRDAWVAGERALLNDGESFSTAHRKKLRALIDEMGPVTLEDRLLAIAGDESIEFFCVMKDAGRGPDPLQVGADLAMHSSAFTRLSSMLFSGGLSTWQVGEGIAGASTDLPATWSALVESFKLAPVAPVSVRLLKGFLHKVELNDKSLVQDLLDGALHEPALLPFIAQLQNANSFDEREFQRIMTGLATHGIPVSNLAHLAHSPVVLSMWAADLSRLLLALIKQPDSFLLAMQILSLRVNFDLGNDRQVDPLLLEAGRTVLDHSQFVSNADYSDAPLSRLIKLCLSQPEHASTARVVFERLKCAVMHKIVHPLAYRQTISALITAYPHVTLDVLFEGGASGRDEHASILYVFDEAENTPTDGFATDDVIDWCQHEPVSRYPFAALIVPLFQYSALSQPESWTPLALRVLNRAPDQIAVLKAYGLRLGPRGLFLRDELMETYACLLGKLSLQVKPESHSTIRTLQLHLQQSAQDQRDEEEQYRESEEGFE
ncbi:hypothetical protein [Pseudomonas sp. Irchel 3A18]|uniref:hypothetical protein n=1 Tax=Pseudomonas sp. Irchel 3A18 TaxID=2008905 RepID=UPI000BA39C8B|nr:hypothetical protein [Pseudomonas sp. Irchel 3A18]